MLLPAQEQSHQLSVVNIEVPVRIFDGRNFVEGLIAEDFQVFENGIEQNIEALYLINKNDVAKKYDDWNFDPELQRHFFLLFHVYEYDPKLGEAVHHLFEDVLLPEDSLSIITPLKSYALKAESFDNKPRNEIAKEFIGLLEKDISLGAAEYNGLIKELKKLVRQSYRIVTWCQYPSDLEDSADSDHMFGLQTALSQYKSTWNELERIRDFNQTRIMNIGKSLKHIRGQKNAFYFYQREYCPEPHPNLVITMMSIYDAMASERQGIQDMFLHRNRQTDIEEKEIIKIFSDSSILFNFIFFDSRPKNTPGQIAWSEQSGDFFKALRSAAFATGGIVDTSTNPFVGFRKGIKATENYYLLYYTPKNLKADGTFRSIKVKLRDHSYEVTHRMGYFAK